MAAYDEAKLSGETCKPRRRAFSGVEAGLFSNIYTAEWLLVRHFSLPMCGTFA